MKGNLRKFLSLLVAAAMLITLLPTAAFAAETVTEVSTAEALISEIKDGANIKLTADIDLTGSITIPMHTTVTIDLGGFTLSTEKLSTATTAIVNNGTLTVKNGIIKSSRLGISSYYYGDDINNPMPILNVDGVTITAPGGVDDNYEAYGYNAVYSSGKATFTNSTITNGYNGISNAGGELTVENSTVSGANQGIWSSGTLFVKSGTYTSIDDYGYGIYNYTGNVTIDGGTFHGYNGLYNNSGEIAINGGEFPNGVTNENYEGAAVLKIKDGVFGSVQNYSDSSLTIDGGVFGTVQNDRGSIAINGGKFTSLPEYTPEEYTSAFVKGSDGYYELKKDLPLVVEVTVGETTTSYADVSRAFSEAFSAANSKITLLGNASLSGKKTLNNTSTLDLNGHNLDCSFDTGAMIEIKNSGSLTVTDSTETPGIVKITSTTTNNGAYFVKATAGTVATDKVNYVCNFGQPFYSYVFDAASASSSVTINGGNFTVQDKSRGVIKKSATAASAVINGGTFTYADNSPFILDSTLLPEGMTQNPSTGTIVANTGKTFKLVVNFPAPFTVTANGVACTSGTEMTYNEFDKVTLKLTGKNSYYYFTGWSVGETTETTDTINVTMTADTTATANMTAYEYTQEDIIEADANGVYHVTTPGQLNYLSYTSYVNKKDFAGKTILLEKDLDFTDVNYFPIGRRSSAKFAGTFDGNGKTISNMNVTATDFCGVIGETASGAVIKNLTVKNSKFVPGGIYDTDRTYAGAIVAAATGAEISGCSSVGNTCNAWFSGAIAGHGYPIKTISDCTVSEANVSGGKNGGIVGFVGSSAAISGVTVTDSTIEGGSIIGNITEAGGTVAIENAAVTNTKDSSGNVTPVIRTSENSTSAPEITISGENTNIQASAIGNVPKECVTITGGTYTTGVDETGNAVELDVTEYIPETMTQDPTTGEVKDDPNKIVKVTTSDGTGITYYATLAEAVAAATAGDTVTLLKNIDMGATFFSVENEITIDLNGYSITSSNKNAAIVVWNRNGTNAKLTIKDSSKAGTGCVNSTTAHGIWVCNGGELILDSGKISATSSNYNYAGINISDINGSVGTVTINGGTVTGSEGIFAQTNGSLTVNGGEVTGTAYYGIFGNGSNSGTSITITGGKVMGNEWGIFHPQQNSTLTVSDNAVISGGITGIEMRAGTLNMTGGEVKGNTNGTYSTVTVEANDSGTTTNGAGIAVSQHTTNNDLTVNISGGEVKGAAAVYEKDVQDITAGVITLNITGGTFTGTSETDGAVYSADCTGFVSGGIFSSNLESDSTKAYIAEGYQSAVYDEATGTYEVKLQNAAKIERSEGTVYYKTLQEAIDGANANETVVILSNVKEDVIVAADDNITLDLNGKTITNESGHTITNNGTLVITDSSADAKGTVDNVTHGKAAVINNANCTILAGSFTRSQEAGVDAATSGGNSYYTIENFGTMTFGEAGGDNSKINVTNTGKYSSMIHNGWYDSAKVTGTATMTINSGTFTGGVNTVKNDEAGDLTITGGAFTCEAQHAVMNWNTAEIKGGTFESTANAALYNGAYASTSVGELTVTGGTFTSATESDIATFASKPGTVAVSGGSFSKVVPKDCCAEGFAPVTTPGENNMYTVDEGFTVTITKDGASTDTFVKSGGTFTIEKADGIVAYVEYDDKFMIKNIYQTGTDGSLKIDNVTADMELTPMPIGVTIINGAQVRIGQGVGADGKVTADLEGSGLRFIATVERNGDLASQVDESKDDEIGILIYPADVAITDFNTEITNKNNNIVVIPAKTYQDPEAKTLFSVALTNLDVSNYNRKFTAKPYVKLDGVYYTDDQAVTRSIYEVAAGLLVKNNTEGEDNTGLQVTGPKAIEVLNAYLNQVGVRLTIDNIAENGTISIRLESEDAANKKNGEYSSKVAFFDISTETTAEGEGVYKITLTALGDATFTEFWNEYIRINNNNGTVVKGIKVNGELLSEANREAAITNEGKTLTFTFSYNDAKNAK